MEFIEKGLVQKIQAIDEVIEEHVRPMLNADGGDAEVIDVKESVSGVDVFIRYSGACVGCSSSSGGTLMAIQNNLKHYLEYEDIRVFQV